VERGDLPKGLKADEAVIGISDLNAVHGTSSTTRPISGGKARISSDGTWLARENPHK
jgi:hypothetical protein